MLGTFVDVNDCPDGHIEIKNHALNLCLGHSLMPMTVRIREGSRWRTRV